jgi:hypothetical protein
VSYTIQRTGLQFTEWLSTDGGAIFDHPAQTEGMTALNGYNEVKYIRASLPESTTDDLRQFVFSALINGMSHLQAGNSPLHCGIWPGHIEFSNIQGELLLVITEVAQKIAQLNRSHVHPNSSLGIGGSWDDTCNAHNQIVDFVDFRTGKIVDFEMVTRSPPFEKGNDDRSANEMDVFGLKKSAPRGKGDARDSDIVTNYDLRIPAEVRELGWKISQDGNDNHAAKSRGRFWDTGPPA